MPSAPGTPARRPEPSGPKKQVISPPRPGKISVTYRLCIPAQDEMGAKQELVHPKATSDHYVPVVKCTQV